MMKIWYVSSFFLYLFLLSSCVDSGGGPSSNDAVRVETQGIFEPVSLYVNGDHVTSDYDLDEYVKGTDPLIINLEVKNNSRYKIFDIDLSFVDSEVLNYDFSLNGDGAKVYPGKNGTCGNIIESGEKCLIELQFTSIVTGIITQEVKLSYKNLVAPAQKSINLTIFAGDPASLIFDPNVTNYIFGNPTGIAQVPLVERDQQQFFEEVLTIENAGELRARHIVQSLNQGCTSRLSGTCPVGQEAAYGLENIDCPDVLYQKERCQVKVRYTNKNQGTDPNLKEVYYFSNFTMDYGRDPNGNLGSLNGYFKSVSANIEARFESSLPSLVFNDVLTVGNRSKLTFKIKNTGYREGFLRRILVYDVGSLDPLFYCQKSASSNFLQCYKQVDDSLTTLADFPFVIQDKESCMNESMNNAIYNDNGCLFDLFFQPSISKTVGESLAYEFRFEYDSRFLDQETIVLNSNVDVTIEGSYLGAAKVVIDKFIIDGVDEAPNKIVDNIPGYNLGRLALMLEAYYSRQAMSIRFKNVGETAATNISLKDGSGQNIVLGASTNLGTFTPAYFADITAAEASCSNIAPGQTCTLTVNFAPIDRATEDDVHNSMFDYWDAYKSPNNYKQFVLTYDDGSLYTDTNIDTITRDVSFKDTASRFYATLVTAGLLGIEQEVYNQGRDEVRTLIAGDTAKIIVRLRNIGTGQIPYLRKIDTAYCSAAPNCPAADDRGSFFIVQTDPLDLTKYSAEKDCRDIINWQGTIAYDARGTLNKGESCLITFEFYIKGDDIAETSFESNPTQFDEALRPWGRNISNFNYYKLEPSFPSVSQAASLALVYFDGDGDNPIKDGLPYDLGLADTYLYGDPKDFTLGATSQRPRVTFTETPFILPTTPLPNTSALIYRPSFTRTTLTNYKGNLMSTTHPTVTLPDTWIYSEMNYYTYTDNLNHIDDSGEISFATHGIDIASNYKNDCADCDYMIHFGTFPVGETHPLAFQFTNINSSYSKILASSISSSSAEFAFDISAIAGGVDISPVTSMDILGTFAPTVAGKYTAIIDYTYDPMFIGATGWRSKIYLVADAIDDAPNLNISYTRFDVATTPGVAPVETEIPSSEIFMSPTRNNEGFVAPFAADQAMALQMVKLETIDFDSGYVKKRFYLENKSLTRPMNNLSFVFRDSASDLKIGNSSVLTGLTIDDNSTAGHCNFGGGSISLAPGEKCYIDFKYQPDTNMNPATTLMTFVYEIAPEQYTEENVMLDLVPLDPSRLEIVGYTQGLVTTSIDGNVDPTAYEFDFSTVTVNESPKILTYGPLTVKNTSAELRASLLKAYEVNYGGVPSTWETINSKPYTTVYSQGKITVKANYECFYGEDPAGLQDYQKGFDGSGSSTCQFVIDLALDINDVARSLDKANYNDMKDFYARLPYYSFERANVDYLSFYFIGSIKPDSYTAPGSIFDVTGTDDKKINFSFDQVEGNSPAAGDVVGYRIFFSKSKSTLYNVVKDGGSFIPGDYYTATGPVDVQFDAAADPLIQRGYIYYFKIVAIRAHASYNAKKFEALSDGLYLSDGDYPILRAMVPLFDHIYVHNFNAMLSKTVITDAGSIKTPQVYADAVSECSSLSANFSDNGVSKTRPYNIMTKNLWDSVKDNPNANNYPNGQDPKALPHWTGPTTYDIHTVYTAASIPGYDASATSQCFDSYGTCYFKCTDGCAADRMVVGGFYGAASAYDYTNYLGETLPLGHTRCYVNVAP